MSSEEIGAVVLTLSVLLVTVHLLGYLFELLKQPRLVGEIVAGCLLGPFVLGRVWPEFFDRLWGTKSGGHGPIETVLGFIYWIGLFLLMFLSGSETRRLMAKENQRQVAWLFGVGSTLPFFIVLLLGRSLPLHLISP